ncbi:rho GTPase-activating protein 12 isoform X1 [Pangasianodon hypophthalmus]|uniref:rho GTPase-activating protein 12 isoform X1 n=1 Tax=Pangasianodon hypophthalmus TaxID=310915 RepID=UPI002307E712|nr:rho GTPase-activating protein 12 isoform X1 [Pangasianodon hypophthalmus]
MSLPQFVMVNFQYEYTARDGRHVSIKPNERYVLVAKTNDHWWHVRKDEATKPFFIPAQYVTVLSSENETIQPSNKQDVQDTPMPYSDTVPPVSLEVTIKDQKFIKTANEKHEHRISKVVIPSDQYKNKSSENVPYEAKAEPGLDPYNLYKDANQLDISQFGLTNYFSLVKGESAYAVSQPHIPTTNSQRTLTVPSEIQSNENPHNDLNDDIRMLIRAGWDPKIWDLKEDRICESVDSVKDSVVQDTKDNERNVEVEVALVSPVSPSSTSPSFSLQQSPGSPTDMSCAFTEKVEDDDLSAVYVNLPRARQSISSLPSASTWGISDPPELHDTLLLGSKGWEIHTDEESGREYYYHPSTGRSTWDYPLSSSMESELGAKELPVSPTPSLSPACSPTDGARWTSDWERVLDEKSGRHYFFNPISGQSSWDPPDDLLTPPLLGNSQQEGVPPPLPEEDYPEDIPATLGQEDALSFAGSSEYSLAHVRKVVIPRACLNRNAPAGWTLNIDPDGVWVFTNDHTQEQWIKSLDDRGQTYYYLKDGSKSEWNLPDLSAGLRQCQLGNGGTVDQGGLGMMRTWRNSTGSQDEKLPLSHRRNASDSDMSASPEMLHNVSNLEKAGILNKTKISENGKKVRKNWGQSWTVLHGGVLTFHKDPKSTPGGTSSKTNQIVPEFTVDLKGATIGWAAKEKSSKKNVLELKSRAGTEFLIQYDTDSIITDWHKVITDTIRQLDMDQHHSDDDEEASEKSSSTEKEDKSSVDKRRMSNAGRQPSSSSTSEADPKKVRNKLRKFLLKRPTLQSVKEKGYIRENVFGCHLQNLCAQEKTTVPSFVMKCIRTVEKRGLGVDGIYRVSGNLAVIQKLRFKADHEDLDLEEGHWDIHVITGALKLFFRELQEPLFPYSHFNSFVQGIKIPDYNSRVSYIRDLVKSLPPHNRDTMEALFSHLRKVIEHGDENRMTLQNVAIVFGPTLLKPEMESANITAYMVFQNQIIEFILSEFEAIFHM